MFSPQMENKFRSIFLSKQNNDKQLIATYLLKGQKSIGDRDRWSHYHF